MGVAWWVEGHRRADRSSLGGGAGSFFGEKEGGPGPRSQALVSRHHRHARKEDHWRSGLPWGCDLDRGRRRGVVPPSALDMMLPPSRAAPGLKMEAPPEGPARSSRRVNMGLALVLSFTLMALHVALESRLTALAPSEVRCGC
jgi:hypothetical protein